MTNCILVTGANGFVGRALCGYLADRQTPFKRAVRLSQDDAISVGELGENTDWSAALQGCETVIHLAARVHVMRDAARSPITEYRKINVDATLNLAKQVATQGLKRLVYVSSVKVNGEETKLGYPFSSRDIPAPQDAYGQSKLEAELALEKFASSTGLELVTVRPPLVYGPGVQANYLRLLKLVAKGAPLPFGSIDNRRSMVAVANLVDLLYICATHQAAPGRTFFASDGQDLSTPDLVRMMAVALKVKPHLFRFPPSLLVGCASILGKRSQVQRLVSSLQVDISETCRTLNWKPPVDPAIATLQTVRSFVNDLR